MSYCKECLALRESQHGSKKWGEEDYSHFQLCNMCRKFKMCAWVGLDALSNVGLGEVDSMAYFSVNVNKHIQKAMDMLNTNVSDLNPMAIFKELEIAQKRIAQIGNCLMDEKYPYGCKMVQKRGSGGYYRRPVGNISVVLDNSSTGIMNIITANEKVINSN